MQFPMFFYNSSYKEWYKIYKHFFKWGSINKTNLAGTKQELQDNTGAE